MEHLYNFFQRKRINPKEILENSDIMVSLKVDGQAFQIVYEDNKFTFHKRSGKSTVVGKELQEVDLYLNKVFREAFKYFSVKLKNIKKICDNKNIHIINFEIIQDDTHIIKYNNPPKNGICLLNIIDINNQELNYDLLIDISKKLDVDIVPIFYKGTLSETIVDKLYNYTIMNCNPNEITKSNFNFFTTDILKILNIQDIDSPLLDTQDHLIEGFVFNINYNGKIFQCKLDNPLFIKLWSNNNIQIENDKNLYFNEVNKILYQVCKNYNSFKKLSDNHLENLILNFNNLINFDIDFIYQIYDIYNQHKELFNFIDFNSNTFNLIPNKIKNNIKEYKVALSFFILLFNKLKTKNILTYDLNPYIKSLNEMLDVDLISKLVYLKIKKILKK